MHRRGRAAVGPWTYPPATETLVQLVVADQFEEVLARAAPDERARFASLLRPALTGPVQLLVTLRPELRDPLLKRPDLYALPRRIHAVPPLRREALRAVVEEPARLAGIAVDDDLVTRLVADTDTGEALPLLVYTLAEPAAGIGRGGGFGPSTAPGGLRRRWRLVV